MLISCAPPSLLRLSGHLWSRPANDFTLLTAEMNSYSENVAHFEVFALDSAAERCCDQCVNVKGVAVCMCPSQRDMIRQRTCSAYTHLIVHAQL